MPYHTMKCAIHKLALVLFVLCALTGGAETVLQRELFGASFTNAYYQPGVKLCNVGAFNGTWGSVPDDSAVAEEEVVAGKTNKYMTCSTSDDGIVFTPTNSAGRKIYSSVVSIRTSGYDDMSRMPSPIGARAAFSIYAPETGGKASYKGWVCSENCWTNLYPISGSSELVPNEWQDVMVRFLKLGDTNDGYVQYWLKRPDDGSYVPLKTGDDVSWIRTGTNVNSRMVGKIGFSGEGGLERILGQETRRGLIVGVGSWYNYLLVESIYVHYNINESGGNTNWWENTGDSAMVRSEGWRSYVIDVDEGANPVICHTPRRHVQGTVEVTEIETQFMSGNDDDEIPPDACARVRLVEMPDETCRFVCLADGQWKTNADWVVSAEAKCTVEISIDNGNRTVAYRYKEGYGLEGGAYRDLCSGQMLPLPCSGKTLQVDFDGYGIVHKIKGKDN